MLQGIISALLLAFFKHDIFFYLGIAEGLLFYFLAGFFSTRYGGAVARSLSAGFWAGVISTIFYWIVLPVCVLIEALVRAQALMKVRDSLTASEALQRAIDQVKPGIFASNAANSSGQNWQVLLVLLVIGLACAMGFAFLGGLIGLRDEARRRN
jgi:hypothetical protein